MPDQGVNIDIGLPVDEAAKKRINEALLKAIEKEIVQPGEALRQDIFGEGSVRGG